MLTRKNGESHENTLVEEAFFDVTLVKFLVVSKEAVQPARKLAMGVEPAARALAGPVCQPHTERRQNATLAAHGSNPHIRLNAPTFQRAPHSPTRCDCRSWIELTMGSSRMVGTVSTSGPLAVELMLLAASSACYFFDRPQALLNCSNSKEAPRVSLKPACLRDFLTFVIRLVLSNNNSIQHRYLN